MRDKEDRREKTDSRKARNIMYESANELLRVRKTEEDKTVERGAIKVQARSYMMAVESRGGVRLKSVRWLLEVVNISRRETSKGDERRKMIWEKKLIERSCDKVTPTLQIQGLSSEARRFLLRFLPSSEIVRIQFFQLSGTLSEHSELFYKIFASREGDAGTRFSN